MHGNRGRTMCLAAPGQFHRHFHAPYHAHLYMCPLHMQSTACARRPHPAVGGRPLVTAHHTTDQKGEQQWLASLL